MYKQITDNVFSIYVELPRSPLKNTNAYLIKGKERNLLIDTGYRTQICMDSLTAGLRELHGPRPRAAFCPLVKIAANESCARAGSRVDSAFAPIYSQASFTLERSTPHGQEEK